MDYKEQMNSFIKKTFVIMGINVLLYCILLYIFSFNYVFSNFLAWIVINIFLVIHSYYNKENQSNVNIFRAIFNLLMYSVITFTVGSIVLIFFVSFLEIDPVVSKIISIFIAIVFKIFLPS